MSQPDYRGARGSNAGDDFHELWALRQALLLLDHDTTLTGITVEGLTSEDQNGVRSDTWDGVDCALYYEGDSAATAKNMDVVQFKYSSSAPTTKWTTARLTSSSSKTGNNSVLRRMGTVFAALKKRRSNSPAGLKIRLVSNQPVDDGVVTIISEASSGKALPADYSSLREASGLDDNTFLEFAAALDFSQTGSRFSLQEEILRTIAGWVESDARPVVDILLRFVRQMMMPDRSNEWITLNTILTQLGFADKKALFPCPSQLASNTFLVQRKVTADIVRDITNGVKHICLHGTGGSGKTTVLRDIRNSLPTGSHMIIFDCYGAGRYLDSDAYRHRAKDAFLQITNELASSLQVPFLLTRSDTTDYPRAFSHRLQLGAETLAKQHKDAILIVAVDAADNSYAAARSIVPPEQSFVFDLVRLGTLPDNVRILITSRTGGLDSLSLPSHFHRIELTGFTRAETETFVRSFWPAASDTWIEDFHHHSFQTPRVQFYALSQCGSDFQRALSCLLPNGKQLSELFENQLFDAQKKVGATEPLDSFCAALSALPHPAPIDDLASISSLAVPAVIDLCADLAPGVRTSKDGVGFADEDFEQFVRSRVAKQLDDCRKQIAERFLERRNFDPYAARHLASALYAAGRGKELVAIVEKEPEATAIVDPVVRREVRFDRMRIAMRACADTDDESALLRTLLAGAEAMRGEDVIADLINDYPDLAAAFMRDGAVRTVLLDSRRIDRHGPLLFHILREDAVAGKAIEARENGRQLHAWLTRRREHKKKLSDDGHTANAWDITERDIAGEIEALLMLRGPSTAIAALNRWTPRSVRIDIARIIAGRLMASGRAYILENSLRDGHLPDPWSIHAIVPLAIAGHPVDIGRLSGALSFIYRRGWADYERMTKNRNEPQTKWLDTVLTGCEILAAHGGDKTLIASLLGTFIDEKNRDVRYLSTSDHVRIDLLLRAYALHSAFKDEPMTVKDFLIEPALPKDGEEKTRASSQRQTEELQKFIKPTILVYEARARLLTGKSTPQEASHLLSAASSVLMNDDYTFSRIYGSSQMRQHLSESIATLCCIPGIDETALYDAACAVFGSRLDAIASQDLAAIERFTLRPSLHADIISRLSDRAKAIIATRTVAHEKRQAILNLVRVVGMFSKEDAAALFKDALTVSEDVDRYTGYEIRTLALMLSLGSNSMASNDRQQAAQQLFTIVTDAALCLENQEDCPWTEVIEALARFDISFALAAAARWQDSAVLDLTSSLTPLLKVALATKTLAPQQIASLLTLLPGVELNLLKALVIAVGGLPAGTRNAIVEDLAQDEMLHHEARGGIAIVRELEGALGANNHPQYWLSTLRNAVEFSASGDSSEEDTKDRPTMGHSQTNESVLKFVSSTTEKDLVAALTTALPDGGSRYPAVEANLRSIRASVSVGDRAHYLNVLAELRSNLIPEAAIADELRSAIEAWNTLPSVRAWCETHLPDILVKRFPSFLQYVVYNGNELRSLLKLLPSTANVPRILAQAIGVHANTLHVETVYALISVLAEASKPKDVVTAASFVIAKRLNAVPASSTDVIDLGDVPVSPTVASARFLFALLSDCDVRMRWRTAHAVRRIVRYGARETLNSLVQLYDRKDDQSFRASGKPFYWMAARLWTVITLDRIAYELPAGIAEHGPLLFKIATDDSFPHVLVRAFAKEAALELIRSGHFSPASSERALLERANEGAFRRETRTQPHNRQNSSGRAFPEPRFKFDHIDTVPYWYSSAIDVFHDVSLQEFLAVADVWIVDKWGSDTDVSRWRDPRERRFAQHQRLNSTNDHGSEPTLEPFSVYLERHGMHCAVGELMLSRALQAQHGDDSNSFEGWLARRGVAVKPYWLADLLCPVPLEKRFWNDEITSVTGWLDEPADAELVRELLIDKERSAILVDGFYEIRTQSRSRDIILNSALIEPATAASLVRALQSSKDPYFAYKVPDEGEHHEIDDPPYRLLGWLAKLDTPTGIDSKDPWRNNVPAPALQPGRKFPKLSCSLSTSGRLSWVDDNGMSWLEHEAWSDLAQKGDAEGHPARFSVGGHRLWMSIERLGDFLQSVEMDLLISVKLLRSERNGDERQNYQFKHNAKLILLRRDGSIETHEGSVGTWRASRS